MKKKLLRLASLSAVVALCFSSLCISASAEAVSGTADCYWSYRRATSLDGLESKSWSGKNFSLNYPTTSSFTYDLQAGDPSHYVQNSFYAVNVPLKDVSANTVISVSFIYKVSSNYFVAYMVDESDLTASIEYTNHLGATGSGSADIVKTFPGLGGSYASSGLSVTGNFMADELNPISNLKILWPQSQYYLRTGKYDYVPELCITSLRVISTGAGEADLKALEEIASKISETNSILQGMYGDILAVCNAIYERNGSILEAQQLSNQYFQTIIPVLNSISSTTSNIYSILNTYFDRVLAAIDNQTLTLEEAIQDAEAALELYLKPMIDYFKELEETTGESASSLPSHKTDLDGFANANTGIDGDAQTGLAAILPVFTAFSFIFSILGIFIGLGLFMLIIRKGLS